MTDNKNTILAIALSALVLIALAILLRHAARKARQEKAAAGTGAAARARAEKRRWQPADGSAERRRHADRSGPDQAGRRGRADDPRRRGGGLAAPADRNRKAFKARSRSRAAASTILLWSSSAKPSTRNRRPIVLLSPSGAPEPFYAEFGWTNAAGANVTVPTADTVWTQSGTGALSVGHPVTLTYDNGQGLEFRRTIAVDDKYLFTVKDEVVNKSDKPVTLYPFALISRHGTPVTLGYYILHEGMIGKFGDKSSEEVTYKSIDEKKLINFNATNAWLGITDKYWAAVLLPKNDAHVIANFKADEVRHRQNLPDRLSARCGFRRAGRDRFGRRAAVRRRQGSPRRQRL